MAHVRVIVETDDGRSHECQVDRVPEDLLTRRWADEAQDIQSDRIKTAFSQAYMVLLGKHNT
jgi:hypothetical protein